MDRIKYFCYYDYQDANKPRDGVQAASSKIDYIIDAINRNGVKVDVISKSPISTKGFNLDFGGIKTKGENTLRHFASFGCQANSLRVISRWLQNLHFFLWAMLNVKRHETIVVYHSLGYCGALSWIKRIKSCCIIGEIEEYYQDVHRYSDAICQSENDFIQSCDSYIFPTSLMNTKFNPKNKPSIIVHGVYNPNTITEDKFSDGRIHVVYGGTFDPKKGGALSAAGIGKFLSKDYVVHICGFGGIEDVAKVKEVIDETNKESESLTIFEGQLSGEDYAKFIQKCHIGLSTQNPSGAFNDTSFPSKILVYLANGLDVVTISIPVVCTSLVSNYLYYYNEQNSKAIAEAVKTVRIGERQYRDILDTINNEFTCNIRKLLKL